MARVIVLIASIVAVLAAVAFAVPFVLGAPPSTLSVALGVGCLFAVALAIGLALQLASLGIGLARSRRVELLNPGNDSIAIALWSREFGSFLGITPPQNAAVEFGRETLMTIGISAGPNGLGFWTGLAVNHESRQIPWLEVVALETRSITRAGRRLTALSVTCASGEETVLLASSLRPFGRAIAGGIEVGGIVRELLARRPITFNG